MADPTVDALALTSLIKVKRHLEIATATTTWDNMLIDFINGVSASIDAYCNRKFVKPASASYTEYFDGEGKSQVAVKNRPITEITSLHDDPDRNYESDTLIDSTLYTYYPNEGIIKLVDEEGIVNNPGIFCNSQRNVKVVYKAGYTTIPYDIEQAVNKWVAKLYGQRGKDGVASERLGAYAVSYKEQDMPEDVKRMLDPYVNINV